MFNGREDRANRTQVALTLTDDSVSIVSIRLPMSNRLADALNNSEIFLDVQSLTGQQQFIAKAAIRAVRPAAIPKADQLELDGRPAPNSSNFDPYAVLKVEKGASGEEIRQSYHRMAKLYHPDRIAFCELPVEVMDYVRAMLVRINLAFEQIGHQESAQQQAAE